MIARVWSAQATPSHAPAYAQHLKNQVLPTLKTLDDYVDALLLERTIADGVEIVVITVWRSLEAIRGFAGDELEHAVVAPEAAALLTRYDRRVRHYEVALKDEP